MTQAVVGRNRPRSGWEHAVLRWLSFVVCPALAGAAFAVLALGVVTWLPALAAMAHALRRWRYEGDDRCFVGVFTAWRSYWRPLLPHSAVSTGLVVVLGANTAFLAGRPGLPAFAFLAAQLGIAAVFVLYHLGLAAAAGCAPDGSVGQWRRHGLALVFATPGRSVVLLLGTLAAPVATLVVPFGPLLLGTSLPVLLAVDLHSRKVHRS